VRLTGCLGLRVVWQEGGIWQDGGLKFNSEFMNDDGELMFV